VRSPNLLAKALGRAQGQGVRVLVRQPHRGSSKFAVDGDPAKARRKPCRTLTAAKAFELKEPCELKDKGSR